MPLLSVHVKSVLCFLVFATMKYLYISDSFAY